MNDVIAVLLAMFVCFVIGFFSVVLLEGTYLFKYIKVRFGRGRRVMLNILQSTGIVLHRVGQMDGDAIWYKEGKTKVYVQNDPSALYREMMIPQMDVPDNDPLPYRQKDPDKVPHDPKVFDNIVERALTRKIPGMDMQFRLLIILLLVVAAGVAFSAYTAYNLDQKVLELTQVVNNMKSVIVPTVEAAGGGVAP
jgi:hypothetical protein